MKPLSILLVGWIGYRLGKSDWRVRPKLVLVAVLLAGTLHAAVRVVLPHDAIEEFASAAPWPVLWVFVAVLETLGIWMPALLVPWAVRQTRILLSGYIIGGATLGALVYYQPFDVIIMNGQRLGPTHPQYELALIFSLVFVAVPFVCGVAVKLRRRRHTQPNPPLQPTSGAERST